MVGTQCRKVLQNEEVKILWDFKILTNKHLAHNMPDLTVVEKVEKITKYQDLKVEVEKLWKKKATVVLVVIGALGAIPREIVNVWKP